MSLGSELRSNYRLRIGLALIGGILWLLWLLDLRDENSASLDRYRQTASQLARFNSQQKQTQWLTRAQEAKETLTVAEGRIWQNPTLGLTQAEMRDWLLRQLQQAKTLNPMVKVSESGGDDKSNDHKNGKADDSSPTDLVMVRAQIEFNTNPKALNNLLAALSNAERQVVVEALSVKQPRTTMTVAIWCKLQPAAVVPAATASAAARGL